MTPASVGVNLLWLVPGDVGGSEQSTVATLRALAELAPTDLALRLFVLEPFGAAHPDLVAAFPTEVLPLSGRSRVARVGGEASWLAARTRGLDLVHHAGGTAPPLRTCPHVLTVHDLQPLEHQATHGPGKRAYLRAVLPHSVRRARAVAVPSDFVRRSVVSRFGVDPARVVTIPHGVEWRPAEATPSDDLRARYQLDGPVVLYPAITYPHKNHATLVEAFATVVGTGHPDALLVLTGGEGSSELDLAARIERLGIRSRVRRTGRISDADMAGLYEAASVVAVPSRYEGFGLPAVEAMAAGVALVAAATTALPEVVGDAGLLVDALDAGAWAEAIARLLDDPSARVDLVAKGHERARRFTWRANAEGFAELYRGALVAP
jgi:glycosyltransferase involved in cell wall biosynthesis